MEVLSFRVYLVRDQILVDYGLALITNPGYNAGYISFGRLDVVVWNHETLYLFYLFPLLPLLSPSSFLMQ